MAFMGKAEILQKIKIAEEQVRAMIKQAEEKRKALQAEGKRMTIEVVDAADAELKKQIDRRIADAKNAIGAKKKAILAEGVRKADALESRARANSSNVRALVLTEFERTADA
ncbi:MAG: hypothetical protein KKE24_02905 [Candidatus Thermoplasmatota archaeon]|nr:hypothetical protein [Candidatus Thermoplasmatota archaeon]